MKSKHELAEEYILVKHRYVEDVLVEIKSLEQEKQNLLSAAETDLMRMAELKEENKYLKERLAKCQADWMEQL